MVTELTDFNRNMMFSIDVLPVPTDEAVREVENRLLGVETNITNWQRRQNANNNFSAVVPYDMELQRKEAKEFLDDLTTRDQRMMFAVITMVLTADTKEQLDSDTEAVQAVARKHMCQLATLKFQQLDGLNTALPIGTRRINAFRTLTTESLAVFMPFKVQEIQDKGGIYFGENAISHNLIMCNKENLLNQSAFLLGVPGSGKSFSAKELITFLILNTEDDILICDPEGEFAPLVQAMGPETGSVIRVAAGGKDRLNAMYMVDGYWSWYGFDSRVEWCACFVSWCANECGYIDAGVIPKFAGCGNGVQWFKDRGLWQDRSYEPRPGDIIFFDWNDEYGQDGSADHVGIVEKVEGGVVYTIEGNSGDRCQENHYTVGYYEISRVWDTGILNRTAATRRLLHKVGSNV